jgi:hypothetical protein
MSFDLYFAGCSPKYGATKFLFSQYLNRNLINNLRPTLSKSDTKMFLDCGAWTAHTKGITIDIDEYVNYINGNSEVISCVAALDVIPGIPGYVTYKDCIEAADKSFSNFVYMRHKVKDVDKLLPTFHQGESFDSLVKLLDYQDDFGKIEYLGIGAMAATLDKKQRQSFMSKCFSLILKKSPELKVHAFGMTDLDLLEQFPFYSADSSTWALAGAMGEIITDFGRIAVSNRKTHDTKYYLHNSELRNRVNNYVSGFGFNLSDLEESAEFRKKFNVAYLKNWEKSYVCKYRPSSSHRLF